NMKKFFALLLSTLPVIVSAAPSTSLPDAYFNPVGPKLTPAEKASVDGVQKWKENAATTAPIIAPDGAVVFPFGQGEPTVVCAVLQVCDVALQRGEMVNTVDLGDKVRWSVTPSVEGSGAGQILHLVIKAYDVGLDTTLMVATDRRVYQ